MQKFQLEVVTPERTVISEEVESLVVPSWTGYLGILANHAPLLSMIRPGEVTVMKDGKGRQFAISTGYLEVSGNRAILLADTIEEAHEIDIERAKAAMERAMSLDARIEDRDEAELAELRAKARLKVAGRKTGE